MLPSPSKWEAKSGGLLPVCAFPKILHLLTGLGNRLDLCFIDCPGPSGVKRIPPTSLRLTSYFALIVFPETIKATVPDGPVPLYERLLGEYDPDGNDRQHPAREIVEREIIHLTDGARMLPDPLPQCRVFDVQFTRPFSNPWERPCRRRWAAPRLRDGPVLRHRAFIIQRVDSRPLNSRDFV